MTRRPYDARRAWRASQLVGLSGSLLATLGYMMAVIGLAGWGLPVFAAGLGLVACGAFDGGHASAFPAAFVEREDGGHR